MTGTILLAVALCVCAGQALARKPSVQECREAGEFIRNAALSRDAGMKSTEHESDMLQKCLARVDASFKVL